MDASYRSPQAGSYLVDAPYGWEIAEADIEFFKLMSEADPEIREDPALRAMRLEAEAEQEAELEAKRPTLEQHARKMKDLFNVSRVLNFDNNGERGSNESFVTDDFMSEPDPDGTILAEEGEIAYLKSVKDSGIRRKKLRKLLSNASSPLQSPQKVKLGSPKKTTPAYHTVYKQKEVVYDSESESDSEIEVPLPKTSTLAKAGAKSFFSRPESPTLSPRSMKTPGKNNFQAPVYDSGTPKVATSPKSKIQKSYFPPPQTSPVKMPSPAKKRPSVSQGYFTSTLGPTINSPQKAPQASRGMAAPLKAKGFFAPPELSDDEDDEDIIVPPMKPIAFNQKFFSAPSSPKNKLGFDDNEDSPLKIPSPPKLQKLINKVNMKKFPDPTSSPSPQKGPSPHTMRKLVNQSFCSKGAATNTISGGYNSDDELVVPPMKPMKFSPRPGTKFAFPKPKLDSDSDEDVTTPKKPNTFNFNKTGLTKSAASPTTKGSKFKQAAAAAMFAGMNRERFIMTALDSELHERLKYLQQVETADAVYATSKLLPNNVNEFIESRKGLPRYLDFAIDLERLIIKAMIAKIEAGETKVSPSNLLNDAKKNLMVSYKALAGDVKALC